MHDEGSGEQVAIGAGRSECLVDGIDKTALWICQMIVFQTVFIRLLVLISPLSTMDFAERVKLVLQPCVQG